MQAVRTVGTAERAEADRARPMAVRVWSWFTAKDKGFAEYKEGLATAAGAVIIIGAIAWAGSIAQAPAARATIPGPAEIFNDALNRMGDNT